MLTLGSSSCSDINIEITLASSLGSSQNVGALSDQLEREVELIEREREREVEVEVIWNESC